jgi:hypothetical protein
MKGTSKIARLPGAIRNELNRRLDNGERNHSILKWINSLPEVQTILAAEFEGEPINRHNLNAWKKSGFRNWQLLQAALLLTLETPGDLDQGTIEKMGANLIRSLQLRYAALAGTLPAQTDDPETDLRRLAGLCTNLSSLRRGDISAGRLDLERKRLAMLQKKSDEEREAEFWQWTKRADIQAKLYPHRDPDKIRREVDRMISSRLMGIRYPDEPDCEPDPAAMI